VAEVSIATQVSMVIVGSWVNYYAELTNAQ
jgi:hypothetical protein